VLEAEGVVRVEEARAADDGELLLAHTPAYLARAAGGGLGRRELAGLGLPWSPQLVERARRSVGATVQAAVAALEDGRGVNLGGGTHHAAPGAGRGFCLFNDVAVAVRALRRDRLVDRVLVVDLDVHQGDGTHACFAGDRRTTTTSVNGARNYPARRVPGDIEEDLPDGTGDAEYLAAVARVLEAGLARGRPDLIVFLAGADPWEHDRLGRLAVTAEGLRARDRAVRDAAAAAGAPLCVTLAGGYGEPIAGTVAINAATVREMAAT
jgi:acetoin utilization deacetylase AcuC-like enzyme